MNYDQHEQLTADMVIAIKEQLTVIEKIQASVLDLQSKDDFEKLESSSKTLLNLVEALSVAAKISPSSV